VTLQRGNDFKAFAEARRRFNQDLEALRVQIDRWLAEHDSREPSMLEIANLATILEARRDLLSELAALDDSFLKQLLAMRGSKVETSG
jgi:hypothetical protein